MKTKMTITNCFGKYVWGHDDVVYEVVNETPRAGDIVARPVGLTKGGIRAIPQNNARDWFAKSMMPSGSRWVVESITGGTGIECRFIIRNRADGEVVKCPHGLSFKKMLDAVEYAKHLNSK